MVGSHTEKKLPFYIYRIANTQLLHIKKMRDKMQRLRLERRRARRASALRLRNHHLYTQAELVCNLVLLLHSKNKNQNLQSSGFLDTITRRTRIVFEDSDSETTDYNSTDNESTE